MMATTPRKLVLASLAVLGIASVANADRGSYSHSRAQASVRYDHGGGSRGYDRGSYSHGDYSHGSYSHGSYDGGHSYSRGYDRGDHYRGGSSFGLSFGYSGYSDRSYLGLNFSTGPRYSGYGNYYGGSRAYYAAPPVIYAPPPVIYSPPVYYERSYYAPSYYTPSYGGYYCR